MNKEYHYFLDLTNPQILKKYKSFKKWKGIPPHIPCSDDEREEFERYLLGDEKYDQLRQQWESEKEESNENKEVTQ